MREYTAENLEKCLEIVALDLKMPVDKISYRIIKENRSFFKKSITIKIDEAFNGANSKDTESIGKGERLLKLDVSPCRTKAYLVIQYDSLENTSSNELFKEEDIKNLIEESRIDVNKPTLNYSEVLKSSGIYLISEGSKAIDDVDDTINLKFKNSTERIDTDDFSNVDYKKICTINSVSKGQILATIIIGKTGKDGIDVYGNIIPRKKKKKQLFRAGRGCFIDESGNFIASVSGKPSYRKGLIEIEELYEHRGNVDIQSGSVYFQGHVKIYGSVLSGMTVHAKDDLEILGSIEEANISAFGNITIHGNAIRSKIVAGSKEKHKLSIIMLYRELATNLSELKKVIEDIKRYNLLGSNKEDGQIIKALLESKFQMITKEAKEVLKILSEASDKDITLEGLIKGKLIGLGPITIKSYLEIDVIIKVLLLRITTLQEELDNSAEIHIEYLQDCEVSATGNININGRGEYQCNITSGGTVEFSKHGTARGGLISAAKEIIAGNVGSPGGAVTKLSVNKDGTIRANKVYHNTIFIIGDKEMLIDQFSERVKANKGIDGFIDIEKYY